VQQTEAETIQYFAFLTKKDFWMRVEYSMRFSFICILPAALVAYYPDVTGKWVVPFLIVMFALVPCNPTIAMTLASISGMLRALVLSLAWGYLSVHAGLLDHHPWAPWGVWYCASCFLMSLFTQGLVSKIGIFIFNVYMVLIYQEAMYEMFPLYLTRQNLIGLGFALAAAVFPFPRHETWKAEALVSSMTQNLSAAFYGITESIWTANLHRAVNLVEIRALRMDVLTARSDVEKVLPLAGWEVWMAQRHSLIRARLRLIDRLMCDLDALVSVLEAISRHPDQWDDNEYFQLFGRILCPWMRTGALHLESFLDKVSRGPVAQTLKKKR
jgi:hypothetical protein